jgi:hypothetical protein
LLQYLTDSVEVLLISKRFVNLHMTNILVTLLLAQLILVLLSVHQFILNFQSWWKTKKNSMLLLKNILFKLEEFMVSILKQMMVHLIFQIREDSVDLKKNLYKIWLMVLGNSLMLKDWKNEWMIDKINIYGKITNKIFQ